MRSLLLLAACVASDAFFSMGGFSLRGSDAEGQPVEEQKEIVEDEPGVLDSLGFVHLGFLEHRLLSGLTKPQTHNQMLAAGHGHVARAAHGGGGGGDSYKLARGADCKPGYDRRGAMCHQKKNVGHHEAAHDRAALEKYHSQDPLAKAAAHAVGPHAVVE